MSRETINVRMRQFSADSDATKRSRDAHLEQSGDVLGSYQPGEENVRSSLALNDETAQLQVGLGTCCNSTNVTTFVKQHPQRYAPCWAPLPCTSPTLSYKYRHMPSLNPIFFCNSISFISSFSKLKQIMKLFSNIND